jgi:hypothetical protein
MPVKHPDPPPAKHPEHPEHLHGVDKHLPLAGQPQIDQRQPVQYTEMGEPIGRDYDHSPSGDAEQHPNPGVRKTQTEQLERSREIAQMGVANWMAEHDERDLDRPQERVPGSSRPEPASARRG